jgi:chaperone required for assembly of F1-ATPase
MPLDSISIDILKNHLDDQTYLNIAKEEANRKASIFKYRVNAHKDVNNEGRFYLQLKGTIGYKYKKKLFVSCSIGSISYDELKALDKQELALKYKTIMQQKASSAILNQFLK